MEVVVVVLAVLAILVLVDAIRAIVVSVIRWSPIIAVGILAGCLAHHQCANSLAALGIGFLASVIARHFWGPRVS